MLNAKPQHYCSATASNDVGAILPCSHLIYSPKVVEEWSPLQKVLRTFVQLLFLPQQRKKASDITVQLQDCMCTK